MIDEYLFLILCAFPNHIKNVQQPLVQWIIKSHSRVTSRENFPKTGENMMKLLVKRLIVVHHSSEYRQYEKERQNATTDASIQAQNGKNNRSRKVRVGFPALLLHSALHWSSDNEPREGAGTHLVLQIPATSAWSIYSHAPPTSSTAAAQSPAAEPLKHLKNVPTVGWQNVSAI